MINTIVDININNSNKHSSIIVCDEGLTAPFV